MIDYCHSIGLGGMALTDHETISGWVKAQSYVQEKKAKDQSWKDFKLILGNEIYLCRNGMDEHSYSPPQDKFYHFILLAKDAIGAQQLQQLSSRAWARSWMRMKRRCPTYYKDIEEIIGANPGHVIASTACLGGYVASKILEYGAKAQKKKSIQREIVDFIDWALRMFGDDLYLELQPSNQEQQLFVNDQLLKMSKALDIPTIITTDAHYLTAEKRKVHKAYLNSKEGEREVDSFYATTYIMTPAEIHWFMDSHIGAEAVEECFRNTQAIADKCADYSLSTKIKVPYIPLRKYDATPAIKQAIQEYITHGVPTIQVFYESDWPSDHDLACRLAEIWPDIYREDGRIQQRYDRIETELKVLWNSSRKMGMAWSAYSLQVADYVKIYWELGDSLVGPGRGSAVGEYINYLLGITQIDPTRESTPLMYWRYLNPERASVLEQFEHWN